MIRSDNKPALPGEEQGRTKTSFEQYAISFQPLDRVVWSVVGIALGLYMWDFPNRRPVPLELMKHQCELGLKWLHEKRIQEMIFLANSVLDVGLPSAEFAREWIAKVGREPI